MSTGLATPTHPYARLVPARGGLATGVLAVLVLAVTGAAFAVQPLLEVCQTQTVPGGSSTTCRVERTLVDEHGLPVLGLLLVPALVAALAVACTAVPALCRPARWTAAVLLGVPACVFVYIPYCALLVPGATLMAFSAYAAPRRAPPAALLPRGPLRSAAVSLGRLVLALGAAAGGAVAGAAGGYALGAAYLLVVYYSRSPFIGDHDVMAGYWGLGFVVALYGGSISAALGSGVAVWRATRRRRPQAPWESGWQDGWAPD